MDDLGAAVIHDVKNRLAELALLLDRRGDSQRETGIVLDAARQLSTLLLVQREAAGLLAAHADSASPSELIVELAEEYRVLFPALEVQADCGEAPPFWFYDAMLVRLALANALHNACRHAKTRVVLSAWVEQNSLVLQVMDDGPGYPQELLHSEAALAPGAHGSTGLGLYLARRIAALHTLQGRAGAVALVNRNGACFRLILP